MFQMLDSKHFSLSTCLLIVFANWIKCQGQDNIQFDQSEANNIIYNSEMNENNNNTNNSIGSRIFHPFNLNGYHNNNDRAINTKSKITISKNPCIVSGTNELVLRCENLSDFRNVTEYLNSSISFLEITRSNISFINLSEFSGFPKLKIISITHSKLRSLFGKLPESIRKLNLSSNDLGACKISDSIFTTRSSNEDSSSHKIFFPQDMTNKNNTGTSLIPNTSHGKDRYGCPILTNETQNSRQNTMKLEVIDLYLSFHSRRRIQPRRTSHVALPKN